PPPLFAAALRPLGACPRFPEKAPPSVQSNARRRGETQPDAREDRDRPGPSVDGSVDRRQQGSTTDGRRDPDWQGSLRTQEGDESKKWGEQDRPGWIADEQVGARASKRAGICGHWQLSPERQCHR